MEGEGTEIKLANHFYGAKRGHFLYFKIDFKKLQCISLGFYIKVQTLHFICPKH